MTSLNDSSIDLTNPDGNDVRTTSSSIGRGMVVFFTPGPVQEFQEGTSNIEKMVEKIEARRKNRLEVRQKVRKRFLMHCKVVAKKYGYKTKIPKEELLKLCDKHKSNEALSKVFDLAKEKVDGDMFYFRDFNEYDLKRRKNFFFRHPIVSFALSMLLFYLSTVVFFCHHWYVDAVCPTDGDQHPYITAIYFVSVTMSTVGYGDVSLVSEPFVGVVFMCVCLVFAVTIFSALTDALFHNFHGLDMNSFLFKRCFGNKFRELPVWQQLDLIMFVRLTELFIYFLVLNCFGMCIVMFFAWESDWDWMTAFYWAVQTTTTIGYGDLDMPENLRYFNMFYTLIGTAFLANILGSVANLKTELADHRRLGDWREREVSANFIESMDGDNDGRISEYEFLVSSLITLKKVSMNDVNEIMIKFRELARGDEYITKRDIEIHIEEHYEEDE